MAWSKKGLVTSVADGTWWKSKKFSLIHQEHLFFLSSDATTRWKSVRSRRSYSCPTKPTPTDAVVVPEVARLRPACSAPTVFFQTKCSSHVSIHWCPSESGFPSFLPHWHHDCPSRRLARTIDHTPTPLPDPFTPHSYPHRLVIISNYIQYHSEGRGGFFYSYLEIEVLAFTTVTCTHQIRRWEWYFLVKLDFVHDPGFLDGGVMTPIGITTSLSSQRWGLGLERVESHWSQCLKSIYKGKTSPHYVCDT